MPFEKGDFILVEYTIRVKETGNLLDTTNEELAKKENVYDPDKLYGPTLIVLGRGWINELVEQELERSDVDKEITVEVPPEKAFGPRDPSKVKVFSLRDFQRRGYTVNVGDVVEIGGMRGVVKSISGGRVMVDFNHPLAGRTLVYTVKVVKKLESLQEKLSALASKILRIPSSELGVEYSESDKKVIVKVPTKYIAKKDIGYAKISLAMEVFDIFKDVTGLVFQEEIARQAQAAQ